MANTHDIRVWARDRGIDIADSGPIPRDVRDEYQAYLTETVGETTIEPDESDERRPAVEPTLTSKVKSVINRPKQSARPSGTRSRARKAAPAKEAKPRVGIEKWLSRAWRGLGMVVGQASESAERMMTYQAPVAGMLLEDVVKGTIVDKALQPFARVEEKTGVVGMLVAPPLAIMMIELFPERADKIIPELRQMMASWIDVAGPKIEAMVERERNFEENYGKKIDDILADVLAPLAENFENADQ